MESCRLQEDGGINGGCGDAEDTADDLLMPDRLQASALMNRYLSTTTYPFSRKMEPAFVIIQLRTLLGAVSELN